MPARREDRRTTAEEAPVHITTKNGRFNLCLAPFNRPESFDAAVIVGVIRQGRTSRICLECLERYRNEIDQILKDETRRRAAK